MSVSVCLFDVHVARDSLVIFITSKRSIRFQWKNLESRRGEKMSKISISYNIFGEKDRFYYHCLSSLPFLPQPFSGCWWKIWDPPFLSLPTVTLVISSWDRCSEDRLPTFPVKLSNTPIHWPSPCAPSSPSFSSHTFCPLTLSHLSPPNSSGTCLTQLGISNRLPSILIV